MCNWRDIHTPSTHIHHMGIYISHNLKTKPIKPSEFNNLFCTFPSPKKFGHVLSSEHTPYLRENFINDLEQHLSSVFPGTESSELDTHLPRNRTMWTNVLGRSRAPITQPLISGLYNAPEFWAPHRRTLEASEEKGQVPPKNISTALSPLYPPDCILSPSSWTSCIFRSS